MQISEEQFQAVSALVKETGAYILEQRRNFQQEKVEQKALHDLVSYVDKTSEEKILQGLLSILPGAAMIAEESGVLQTNSPFCWILDPLDGTTNFIHHIPHFCISLALQYQGNLVAAWVYEIVSDSLFTAELGKGSQCNGNSIHVSQQTQLEKSLIATGFPVNNYDFIDAHMQSVKEVVLKTRGVRRLGTAAFDLCMVACGKVEAYFEYALKPWDVAAGTLIVREAGGKVTDYANNEENVLFGEQILASNTHVHEQMFEIVFRR